MRHSANPLRSFILLAILISSISSIQASLYHLSAKVRDKASGFEMTDATYRLLLLPDSIEVAKGETVSRWLSGSSDNWTHHSDPKFTIRNIDTDKKYVLEITAVGYEPLYMDVDPSSLGKRESELYLGFLEMKKARALDELTVTATKVKFYNKGDTIIYNADAFQLAEGSMLDALISQLPGAELKDNGQIFVNGRIVESLLLNSKDFFKGDNKIMLENLGAYTVKNIAVYDGQKEEDKIMGQNYGKKLLTMDVRLKKQYQIGTLLNAEAGYGIRDKFLGRLFGLWYNNISRISFYGNANNNSNTWKPSQKGTSAMPATTAEEITTYSGGTDYNVTLPRTPMQFEGNANLSYTKTKGDVRSYTTNFLPGGDTWGYSFSNSLLTSFLLSTEHTVEANADNWNWQITPKFKYTKNSDESRLISATFNREWDDIDRDYLEGIYSGNSSQVLSSMINRNVKERYANGNRILFDIESEGKHKVNSTDAITYSAAYNYEKRHSSSNELIRLNFEDNPIPALNDLRHYDNAPNFNWRAKGSIGYIWAITSNLFADVDYTYGRHYSRSVSDLFRNEAYVDSQLKGIFDNLAPSAAGKYDAFDASNSFDSRYKEETHDVNFKFDYEYKDFSLNIELPLSIRRQWLHYLRGDVDAHLKRTKVFPGNFDGSINVNHGETTPIWIYIGYSREVTSPDMVDMVDFTNSLDPLNVRKGNPYLKDASSDNIRAYFNQTLDAQHNRKHGYGISATFFRNTLAYGYSYDRSTGVKTGMMYNVMGNASYSANQSFNTDFGHLNCFSFENKTFLGYDRSADMVSADEKAPQKNIVNSYRVQELLKLSYKYSRLRVTGQAIVQWRHFTSMQTGFVPFNAWDMRYIVSGDLKLRANFSINTDFNLYARRGYSEPSLNKNSYVWNVRISYSMLKGNLLWMLDGFDILHNLKNVSYAVNAQGRTETYKGVVPRYFMLHVQWKFHKAPLKK